MPESFETGCGCTININSQAPTIAPYVVSVAGLNGIISLDGTGVLDISTSGNTIVFGLSAGAGLGSVTSVNASSSNSNLTVSGGPITTNGTFTFNLAGNLGSISGLVMAADQMLYSTGAATFTQTTLTAQARQLLDDASFSAMRTTLGLAIGTDVQPFSQDLSDFVTNASWSGANLTLLGNITAVDALFANGVFGADVQVDGNANVDGNFTAGTVSGDGSGLTNLDAGDIATGTLAVARGGTGLASYTTGQVLYASGATTIAGLTAGASGTFLRFAGAGVAPVVSTLVLPNAATTGDIFMATSSNTMGRLANVATGNVLLSGGVGVASTFGKVTSSHTDGSTIVTMSGGTTGDISAFSSSVAFNDTATFNQAVSILGLLLDGTVFEGNAGDILTSTGAGTAWSKQIDIDTLNIVTNFSLEGTITGAGTTGNQTINKPSGTVRFAAAASSLVVTNSLCTTNHRVLAMCCTNDATATVKNVVTTNGSFTIVLEAAATGESEVYWELREIT